jgi:glycosyltransferase involved in cell wall biosynthesis
LSEDAHDALYVAVLPFYRQECMKELARISKRPVVASAGSRHVDPTISTGISRDLYANVKNIVLANRILLQIGGWGGALKAKTTVLDLNPRSLTAWVILLARTLIGRRTLVWGHLNPRAGAGSKTALLRKTMRRMSDGTILYGYDSVPQARADVPNNAIWVAPNSLYRAQDMIPSVDDGPYNSVIYVGRLVVEKKIDVLIEGFMRSNLKAAGVTLKIVGSGQDQSRLQDLISDLGGSEHITFLGHITDVGELRELYANALCSVSPGYVGLSLTQSLGFGVPMLISRDEPHSPEIELARFGGVEFFDTDSPEALAVHLNKLHKSESREERLTLAQSVRATYSAEAMANGLNRAFENRKQDIGEDGWPTQA